MSLTREQTDPAEVTPYIKYSFTAHIGFAILAWFFLNRQVSRTSEIYRIDFIGPTAGIINRDMESGSPGRTAPAPAGKIAPEKRGDDFAVRKHHSSLPRPSILSNSNEAKPSPAEDAAVPSPPGKESKPGAGNSEGAGTSVTSDMPNFPFPWYITQVRSSLWNQWSSHMPSGGGEALVMFSILRNGQVTDLRVESSSGDSGFDYVALSSVQSAAPFPPLPAGFPDSFLKIHVRFDSQ